MQHANERAGYLHAVLEETEVLQQNRPTCYLKKLRPAKEGLRKVKELEVERIRITKVIRI